MLVIRVALLLSYRLLVSYLGEELKCGVSIIIGVGGSIKIIIIHIIIQMHDTAVYTAQFFGIQLLLYHYLQSGNSLGDSLGIYHHQ